jgi:hypothetical protein
MKSRDITQTAIFRKYGAKGMRRYCIAWGATMYFLLISIGVSGIFALMQIRDENASRVLLFAAVALIVAVASLLTRMLIGTFNELQTLGSYQKK